MRTTSKIIAKGKNGKVTRTEYTKIFTGDYWYTVYNKAGEFVKRISPREIDELNKAIAALN